LIDIYLKQIVEQSVHNMHICKLYIWKLGKMYTIQY